MVGNSSITVEHCLEQVEEALNVSSVFFGHGTDNAWDEACWLVQTILKRDGVNDFAPNTTVNLAQQEVINQLLERRVGEQRPMAYLLKEAWFAGLSFFVDERVLIPRSPIGELIANQFEPFLQNSPSNILDLCTGSGCIGIACAKVFADAEVDLADISAEALQVASINIKKHELEHRVRCVNSNLFENVTGLYDVIVSNPPYVSEQEYQALPEEYLKEPEIGLVSTSNGLTIPLSIIANAAKYLAPGGILILELGYSWQALVEHSPELPMNWLEFEHGGEGICMLTLEQLAKYKS